MDDLLVTGVQCHLHWEDPQANRTHIADLLSDIGQTDLIVLPEMFTTGFTMRPETMAEHHDPNTMETIQWMRMLAARHDAAITGSVSVEDDALYYNRMYFVTPDGNTLWYDKYHLFSFANEDDHYSAGEDRVVVNWRGWNILLQVCYDLRFPVYSRNTIDQRQPDYDLAVYIASWPAARNHPWKALLMARAIENQCYIVGVNRVGVDGNNIAYSGDSSVIDARGGYLKQALASQEEVFDACCSASDLQDFRKKFPVLFDQ